MDNDSQAKFDKLKIAARYWALGAGTIDPGYHMVSEALELGLKHHDGARNGGAPEFIHQLRIFHHARAHLKGIRNPVAVLTLICLHDIVEDPNQKTKKYISLDEIADRFGVPISRKVKLLSKKILGQDNADYSLDTIFEDPDTSVVKALDRIDNLSGLVTVFAKPRAFRYIKETEEEFVPRLQSARRRFVDQEGLYELAKKEIQYNLDLTKMILGYDQANSTTEAA